MTRSRIAVTFTFTLACLAITLSLAVRAHAQGTFKNLVKFASPNGGPVGPLVQATDGNFYGATGGGGPTNSGTIFRVTPAGKLSLIHVFCSQPQCADGSNPIWGPVLGSDGNLYGVTETGGSDAAGLPGSGVFYKLTLGGEITILHTFCTATPCADGQYPNGIVLGIDGNFYGTAYAGGAFNNGTVFAINSTGKLKVLHSFCALGCANGSEPILPAIQASNGNIYGVTGYGGTVGAGVLFELTPAGQYQVLHNFCDSSPCSGGPSNLIVEGANGNIFGTTTAGGPSTDYGTVFEFAATKRYSVLHNFEFLEGIAFAGLTPANDGNLYGSTTGPATGANGGSIFEVTSKGEYTPLYTFNACGVGGYDPTNPLVQATDGLLYGTTIYGGAIDCGGNGTIFSFDNNLTPLVKTVPTGGKAGKRILILGNGLTGTTSVTFNGVPAEFTVEKDTFIRATVPAGATTGAVSVVTPTGTLNSNPQFVVTK